MGGVYAFVIGAIAIIASFIFGWRSTTTKISGEVTIQKERAEQAERKAELSQNVSETVVDVAKKQSEAKTEIEKASADLKTAEVQHDTNAALEVARRLAQIAQGLL